MGGSDGEGRLLALLATLGEVTSRPMTGGLGLYLGETIFGIFHDDHLYLKEDEVSNVEFVSRGMGPFSPNGLQTLKSYYELPLDVLADPEELLAWAEKAIRAAH